MKFQKYLFKAKFKKRFKRFFVEFEINGKRFLAHCPNTGSMETCLKEDAEILLSYNENPKRKLLFTLEMIKPSKSWIFVNTLQINKIIEYFLFNKHPLLKEFIDGYSFLKREPKFLNHKFDFLLLNEIDKNELKKFSPKELQNKPNEISPLIIEIKNVTYYNSQLNSLQFPDAKTKRGQNHIKLLMDYIKKNYKCMIIFVLSRSEGNFFMPAYHIDLQFAHLLKEFYYLGGIVLPIRLEIKIQKKNNEYKFLNFNQKEIYEVELDLKEKLDFVLK
jgi:sugar fermentation stimulation protein A